MREDPVNTVFRRIKRHSCVAVMLLVAIHAIQIAVVG